MTVLGIMGGSGLYEMPGLRDVERTTVETPFGSPSDALVTGTLHGVYIIEEILAAGDLP